MSSSFMNAYFGPLSREYCAYFYVLSIFFGIVFVIVLLSIVGFIAMNYKKVNGMYMMNSVLVLVNLFIVYFANRLLHTMCVKSI